MKGNKESWRNFLVWLKERGLDGVRLIVGGRISTRNAPGCKISALHGAFLQKHHVKHAEKQALRGDDDA